MPKRERSGELSNPGGQVAAGDPESGRRVGRIVRQLRQGLLRAGAQFGVADGLGAARAGRRRRPPVGAIPAGRGIPLEAANGGRPMARSGYHRHRFSQRFLPHVRHVPRLLSPAGALPGVRWGRRGTLWVRLPTLDPSLSAWQAEAPAPRTPRRFNYCIGWFRAIIAPMHSAIRVGLLGEFNQQQKAHHAIPRALAAASEDGVETTWISTDSVEKGATLAEFDGLWCVPGMPYKSADGAISAIRFARRSRLPFLGTSAGFQYTLIEYARHVLGLAEADHQKTNPRAAIPLITPLGCGLAGVPSAW